MREKKTLIHLIVPRLLFNVVGHLASGRKGNEEKGRRTFLRFFFAAFGWPMSLRGHRDSRGDDPSALGTRHSVFSLEEETFRPLVFLRGRVKVGRDYARGVQGRNGQICI